MQSYQFFNCQGTFLLDRGFQILIEAYPQVKRQLDLKRLGLRSFAPGAFLAFGKGELRMVSDPIRSPKYILRTITSGIASIKDLLILLLLRFKQVFFEGPYTALEECQGTPPPNTESFMLGKLGLSTVLVDRFLRPFFEAIYVTPLAQQSSACFRFVLRMLAEGRTSLPERGMQAVADQLAEDLLVRLCSPIVEVRPTGVRIDAEWKDFDAVVLAVDLPAARAFLPELDQTDEGTRSSTWYFALPSPPPVSEPLIVLNSTLQTGPDEADLPRLVNVAFPSLVQPSYAPKGWDLAAVTVRGPEKLGFGESWVRHELGCLFGIGSLDAWRLLRVYHLDFHQPAQWPRTLQPRVPVASGIYVCGDHCAEPTLDSAMRSGQRAAEAVLEAIFVADLRRV
ncbi:unnamed protein product [Durusdinium trenchii]|uniref:Amine oxidase domain-containing protein n=1 Tax=Durusdinium trenchii TaxID=1381693 RepID=A0ABP0P1Z7_9DINO